MKMKTQIETPLLCSIKTAASLLNINASSLYRWLHKKDCPLKLVRLDGRKKNLLLNRQQVESVAANTKEQ
jgi:hypothetical protein